MLRVVLFCGVLGCNADRTGVDAYIRQLTQWAPVERDADRAIREILATHFVDEAAVLRVARDLEPRVQAHLAVVRAHTPEGPSAIAAHNQYRLAWEALAVGLGDVRRGLDAPDQAALAAGRQALESWQQQLMTVVARLRSE